MDLHFGDSKPTDDERAAVDALLGSPESSWEGAARDEMRAADLRWARGGREARARRDLPIVFHGCSVADVRAIARTREVPPLLAPREVWLVENGRIRRAAFAGGLSAGAA